MSQFKCIRLPAVTNQQDGEVEKNSIIGSAIYGKVYLITSHASNLARNHKDADDDKTKEFLLLFLF